MSYLKPIGNQQQEVQQFHIFTPFPKLPIELRFEVWNYALQAAPRLIKLNCREDDEPQLVVNRGPNFKSQAHWNLNYGKPLCTPTLAFTKFKLSPCVTSVMLFVCKESRQLALQVFEFCFSTSLNRVFKPKVWLIHSGEACEINLNRSDVLYDGFCFRPAADIIYLTGEGAYQAFGRAEPVEIKTENVRNLAVDWRIFKLLFCHARKHFEGVQEVIVVDSEPEKMLKKKKIKAYLKKQQSGVVLPTVMAMTEKKLAEYVQVLRTYEDDVRLKSIEKDRRYILK